MNWQTEGVNGNYGSAKFEEIPPKKTEDIHVKVVQFSITQHSSQNRNSPRSLFETA